MAGKKKGYLALIRHGESQWNEKGLWTGWTDIPLTTKGQEEARSAAAVLIDVKFDLAVTSDLVRASETLEIIKQELKIPQLPTIKHKAYKERHYGIFTGKNKWEIKKEVGEEKFKKIRRGWNEPIPEGETLEDVYNRVIPHLTEHIMPKVIGGTNVMVVAHGNTHRAIIKHLEGISHEKIEEIELVTGEVVLYAFNKKGKIVLKEKRSVNKSKS